MPGPSGEENIGVLQTDSSQTDGSNSDIYFEGELPRIVIRLMEGSNLPVGGALRLRKNQVAAWLQNIASTTGSTDTMLSMLPISSKRWLKQNFPDLCELSSIDECIDKKRRAPDPHYILNVIQRGADQCLNICHPLPGPTAEAFTALLKQTFPIASDREEIIKKIKPSVRQWLEVSNVCVSLNNQGKAIRAIQAYIEGDDTALTLYPLDYGYKPSFLRSALRAIKTLIPEVNSEYLKSQEIKNLAVSLSKQYRGNLLLDKCKAVLHQGADSGHKGELAVLLAVVLRMSNKHKDMVKQKLIESGRLRDT